MLVPPLRIPVRTNLSELLGVWLDAVNQGTQENTTNENETGQNNDERLEFSLQRISISLFVNAPFEEPTFGRKCGERL